MFELPLFEALLLVGLISGVPLAASALVGLIAATVQAATQIQDQTVSYLIKLVTVSGLLLLFAGRIETLLVSFLQRMIGGLVIVGQR